MGQFSRTDSLRFKVGSFSGTLDMIDLLMQIQLALKGWTLKPGVSVKQSKMFYFWMLKSIISQKSVTCQTKIQSFGFFGILASIMQITPARKWRKWKVYEDNESIITQI